MPRTLEQLKNEIRAKHGNHVLFDETTYVDGGIKARFVDSDYGEWWARPYWVAVYGQGHPKRGRELAKAKMRIKVNTVVQRLQVKHGDVVTLDVSTYKQMTYPARFIDKVYGEWWNRPENVITYGRGHPARTKQARTTRYKQMSVHNKLPIEVILQRLETRHGNTVTLDTSTYVNVNSKARFIDKEHGAWWGYVANVTKGVGHPNRSHNKWLATCASFKPILHWKTPKPCLVQSSYEHAVVTWLNHNQYDFDWQIPIQTHLINQRGRSRIYHIDLFIKSGPYAHTYVEIKGTWDTKVGRLGRQKWEWFHSTHPNSILWTESELISMGIFKDGRSYLRNLQKTS
jgi:hypothetical protein